MASMSEQEKQIYIATVKAHEAQQAQQFKFLQHMKVEDQSVAAAQGQQSKKECRFVDDYRPYQLCRHMKQKGYCTQGEGCFYAHTIEELHVTSPDQPNPLVGADAGGQPDLKMKKKKYICQQYEQGNCLLGKVCGLAHGQEEMGTVGLAVTGNPKTTMCQNFERGSCVWGKHCDRAHGMKEIGLQKPPPDLLMTSSAKRPRHLPRLKSELKGLSQSQKKDYEDHLKNLETMRTNAKIFGVKSDLYPGED
eukprot:gnl/MRDRNA2_/MRDRNA2_78975_c0_seq2.p1 gnl/MRDRNA2_/MRDRNA2_78975_c0~~gnl/MRDRNA2_/MRDRNA2_78975_c0_seq2.p1  ORF type:complete len:288 (+),score=63.65 gnl/MRDRNA2_/MRDRNA2_78975_c0_seq2:119-865(+)